MLSRVGALIDTVGWRKRYETFAQGWPARSRDGISFHRTAKAQYRYRARGNGPVIVFLADPPVTIEAYDEIYETFSGQYRTIVIEAAGMGFSAASNAYGFGFQEANNDLVEVLSAVAGEGAILAFSCVAGLGAVDIAVRYPHLVSRLFLFQTTDWTNFLDWLDRRDPKRLLRKPVIGQIGMKRLAPERAPVWLAFATGRRDKVAPLCACAAEGFKHKMAFSLASSFQRYLAGHDPLGKPGQPLTVIWGEKDRSHTVKSIEGSRNLAPQADIVSLPDLGHFPELEDPRKILDLLTVAMNKQSP